MSRMGSKCVAIQIMSRLNGWDPTRIRGFDTDYSPMLAYKQDKVLTGDSQEIPNGFGKCTPAAGEFREKFTDSPTPSHATRGANPYEDKPGA